MNKPTTIIILSPPFYSHFTPLLALAQALQHAGADIAVGCSREFAPAIREQGLEWVEVQINRNANTGQATATHQSASEQQRLHEFLAASRQGPVATLRTQTRHRFADMLANPEQLRERIAQLHAERQPQLWIVDQLSYGATLALVAQQRRFVTFCPPHPLSIPSVDGIFGVPPRWPQAFTVPAAEVAVLRAEALALQQRFTARCNQLLADDGVSVANAFALTSPELIVHNYPQFAAVDTVPQRVFCGYSFADAEVPRTASPLGTPECIVIALGTFLSARSDVLIDLGQQLRRLYPQARLVIGAGEQAATVQTTITAPTVIQPFIEQRRWLRQADLFIHHGGVSSFTEALYYGVPMVVLPFSSDQFNVAVDVERHGLGAVLDPNHLTAPALQEAVIQARSAPTRQNLAHYTQQLRARGPGYAAQAILQRL
jgi:hypothetical protein